MKLISFILRQYIIINENNTQVLHMIKVKNNVAKLLKTVNAISEFRSGFYKSIMSSLGVISPTRKQ